MKKSYFKVSYQKLSDGSSAKMNVIIPTHEFSFGYTEADIRDFLVLQSPTVTDIKLIDDIKLISQVEALIEGIDFDFTVLQ